MIFMIYRWSDVHMIFLHSADYQLDTSRGDREGTLFNYGLIGSWNYGTIFKYWVWYSPDRTTIP